jgi:hypothetical protein
LTDALAPQFQVEIAEHSWQKAMCSIQLAVNKKNAKAFPLGELASQAGLGPSMRVFSKKLSSWFFSGSS